MIQQPLEGTATYIGKGQTVCSKRVPGRFEPEFCHPYHGTIMNPYQNTSQEAKLLKDQYFHC